MLDDILVSKMTTGWHFGPPDDSTGRHFGILDDFTGWHCGHRMLLLDDVVVFSRGPHGRWRLNLRGWHRDPRKAFYYSDAVIRADGI